MSGSACALTGLAGKSSENVAVAAVATKSSASPTSNPSRISRGSHTVILSATSMEDEAAGHRGTNAGTYLLRSVGNAMERAFGLNLDPQGLLGQ